MKEGERINQRTYIYIYIYTHTHICIYNTCVVTARGKGGGWMEVGNGDVKRLTWAMGTRCRVQMMFGWLVHLKPV